MLSDDREARVRDGRIIPGRWKRIPISSPSNPRIIWWNNLLVENAHIAVKAEVDAEEQLGNIFIVYLSVPMACIHIPICMCM
jgi:hypothetical protein